MKASADMVIEVFVGYTLIKYVHKHTDLHLVCGMSK